ncbi:MAG TPA: glutathione S-transferase N-terminal domain-containing protein [Woeseiaceae bacterium]|nr:glutathione S-transferase N-terminal domain-containing protein [Woeseiaceae bacterium]
MTDRRRLVHTVVLFVLPLFAAGFGWPLWAAIIAVLLMLLWRWLIALSGFAWPEKQPPLVLDSISASHFVEKVRWNLDVAGIEYVEKPAGGTLGAYFGGRTVPRLRIRTGHARSEIGNSPEILRYLWGAWGAQLGERGRHLEPTPERLELEARLDRYGVNLQVWIYHHLLEDRDLTLRAWGAGNPDVPLWQRLLLRPLYPLLAWLIRKSFRITPRSYEKACGHIETLLAEMNATLGDGRASILGGDRLNYTDYEFAAMTGLWLQPRNYGGGRADKVRIERSQATSPMRADIERWIEDYPVAVAWVQRLYAEERPCRRENS